MPPIGSIIKFWNFIIKWALKISKISQLCYFLLKISSSHISVRRTQPWVREPHGRSHRRTSSHGDGLNLTLITGSQTHYHSRPHETVHDCRLYCALPSKATTDLSLSYLNKVSAFPMITYLLMWLFDRHVSFMRHFYLKYADCINAECAAEIWYEIAWNQLPHLDPQGSRHMDGAILFATRRSR